LRTPGEWDLVGGRAEDKPKLAGIEHQRRGPLDGLTQAFVVQEIWRHRLAKGVVAFEFASGPGLERIRPPVGFRARHPEPGFGEHP
jgi:hypothetical protein